MSLESIFKLSLIMNMVDHLSGPLAGIASRVGADVAKLDALSQTFGGLVKTGVAMQEIGSQITGAVLAPMQATFETRRALGELASLGVEDLGAMESAARQFSDQWSGTTKADFISAAYDIKSGISSLSDEGVAEFTSLAALTAKATKATASEMTSLFATGYGIYKNYYDGLSDIQFGELFSAGIAESVRAFKTSGSGMAQGIQSLGASATTANVPLEEQLAILGMLQATMGGAEAGTKYKAFLRSAAKGGEALGLSFLDANNQLLSMPEILEQLRSKFGDTMDAAEKMELQKAFGDAEAVALIDLLYSKTGDLQDNILNLYSAMGQGTDVVQKMASAIQETEPERFERLRQRIHNVTESIGNLLLPTVNDLMSKGEQVLTKAAGWIEGNQQLVKTILLIVLAAGVFLTVAGTVIAVVSGVGLVFTRAAAMGKIFVAAIKHIPSALDTIRLYGMFAGDALRAAFTRIHAAGSVAVNAVRNVASSLFHLAKNAVVSGISAVKSMAVSLAAMAKQAITTAVTALTPLVSSVWSFTAALLANPVTWVVIGIAALIAALVLLYNKCEWFRNGVHAMLDSIREKAGAFLNALKNLCSAAVVLIGRGLDAVKAAAQEKLDGMKRTYAAHGGGVRGAFAVMMQGTKSIFTAGFSALDNLTGNRLSAIRDTAAQKLDGLKAVYAAHGGGVRGAAAAAMEGVKGVFAAGYNALDTLTGGRLSGIRDKFFEKLSPVSGVVEHILSAAQDAASESLGNMQAAFEAHGGGIQGAAAAAMEGVKGVFGLGYAVLDSVTGGRLSEIKGRFASAMSGIVQGVGQKFTEARAAFLSGLDGIRNAIANAVSWFFESGRRIVSTFASGIRSAFSGAVDAVRGGLQKVRNLLPFSDAREGPLSTLTLSGQRTMTTYAHGLNLAQDIPAQEMERGLRQARAALEREPVGKIEIGAASENEDNDTGETGKTRSDGKQVIIEKLIMQVDLKKIKDLQTLINLAKEIESFAMTGGTDTEAGSE